MYLDQKERIQYFLVRCVFAQIILVILKETVQENKICTWREHLYFEEVLVAWKVNISHETIIRIHGKTIQVYNLWIHILCSLEII